MAEDPFAHLHNESYADATSFPRAEFDTLITTTGRATIPLNGPWHFTPDLFDEGLRQRWYEADATPPSDWDKPRDYDESGAVRVWVPGCWSMQKPELRYFEGAAWYARTFKWDGRAPRLFLQAGAANYEARVFLNGHFVAAHRGGSTPFSVELTQHVQHGENRLLIQVENRRRADRVPMHHFDWFNHGGLYRDVALVPLPRTFIRDLFVRLTDEGIAVDVGLSDPADGTVSCQIAKLGMDLAIPVVQGHGSATIQASPELWSPETPRLYDVTASFGADQVSDRVGFRRIQAIGERIRLNDADLYLRGICVHEDDVLAGKCSDEADIRRRFADAKALGCNFLRLAHYPHHDLVARIADEVGILLWAEIPVYWAIDFANPDTYADAENQLLELIHRDRNRASVIIWGVGNENADTNARFAFMSRLAERARTADPTRLISAACLINRDLFRIEDRLAAHLDVIGINEYFGWYEPDFTGLEQLLANSRPGKPVVISETGADALAGHRGPVTDLFTEDRQAEIYRRQLAIVAGAPYIRGFCPWLLYDYRTERRQTRFQRGFNRKGLIAEDKRTRKLAFSVLAAHYHGLMQTRTPS
jgi:beta-glucuronidase